MMVKTENYCVLVLLITDCLMMKLPSENFSSFVMLMMRVLMFELLLMVDEARLCL